LLFLLRRIFEHQAEQIVSLYGWFNCWENSSDWLFLQSMLCARSEIFVMAITTAFVVKTI